MISPRLCCLKLPRLAVASSCDPPVHAAADGAHGPPAHGDNTPEEQTGLWCGSTYPKTLDNRMELPILHGGIIIL